MGPLDSSMPPSPACARVQPLLERYHDAALSTGEAATVEQHLTTCAGCAAEVTGYGTLRAVLRAPVEAELALRPAEGMWERIAPELDTAPVRVAAARPSVLGALLDAWRLWHRPVLALATVAVVVVALLLAQSWTPRDIQVAQEAFVIDHIDTDEDGVLFLSTGDADMTIIWVIPSEDDDSVNPQVAL